MINSKYNALFFYKNIIIFLAEAEYSYFSADFRFKDSCEYFRVQQMACLFSNVQYLVSAWRQSNFGACLHALKPDIAHITS